jgi:hypothetical protein
MFSVDLVVLVEFQSVKRGFDSRYWTNITGLMDKARLISKPRLEVRILRDVTSLGQTLNDTISPGSSIGRAIDC